MPPRPGDSGRHGTGEARRLQPHFVAAFFNESFKRLGGTLREREPKRYEATHVPAVIRNRDRIIGMRDPVLTRYERLTFEKELISVPGKPLAEFICPGHPLLDATIDLILERHRDLLRQGAILVDENSMDEDVRALVYLEHSIQDARTDRSGNRRVVSRQVQFAEVTASGDVRGAGYAPYLDYRPPTESELALIRHMEEPGWLRDEIESRALDYLSGTWCPHLQEVKSLQRADGRQDHGRSQGKAYDGDQLLGPSGRNSSSSRNWRARLMQDQLRQGPSAGRRVDDAAAETHGGPPAGTPHLAASAQRHRRSTDRTGRTSMS